MRDKVFGILAPIMGGTLLFGQLAQILGAPKPWIIGIALCGAAFGTWVAFRSPRKKGQ